MTARATIRLRFIRAATALATSSGVPRNSVIDDISAAAYSGVWSQPGTTEGQ